MALFYQNTREKATLPGKDPLLTVLEGFAAVRVTCFAACKYRQIRVLGWQEDVEVSYRPVHVSVATQSAFRAISSGSDHQTLSTLLGIAPCQHLSRSMSERIAGTESYVRQSCVYVAWVGASGSHDIFLFVHNPPQSPQPHSRYGRYASQAQLLESRLCWQFLHPRLGTASNRRRLEGNRMVLEK